MVALFHPSLCVFMSQEVYLVHVELVTATRQGPSIMLGP